MNHALSQMPHVAPTEVAFSVSSIAVSPGIGLHRSYRQFPNRSWSIDVDLILRRDVTTLLKQGSVCAHVIETVSFIVSSLPPSVAMDDAVRTIGAFYCSLRHHSRLSALSIARVRLALRDEAAGSCVTFDQDVKTFPSFRQERKSWGSVLVLNEDSQSLRSFGLYMLNVAPNAGIPMHFHRQMRESELVLDTGLFCGEESLLPGSVFRWGSRKHEYRNASAATASVLCMDLPAFIPEDEIECSGPPPHVRCLDDTAVFWNECAWAASTSSDMKRESERQKRARASDSSLGQPRKRPRLPSFSFPGALSTVDASARSSVVSGAAVMPPDAQQIVHVEMDPSRWLAPNAVLVVLYTDAHDLLLVRHKKRGWEIPGGKVEMGERPVEAALRELAEESGVVLDEAQLRPMLQYWLLDGSAAGVDGRSGGSNSSPVPEWHAKTVFSARFDPSVARLPLHHETSAIRLLNLYDRPVQPESDPHSASWTHSNRRKTFRPSLTELRWFVNSFVQGVRGLREFSPLMKDEVFPLVLLSALEGCASSY